MPPRCSRRSSRHAEDRAHSWLKGRPADPARLRICERMHKVMLTPERHLSLAVWYTRRRHTRSRAQRVGGSRAARSCSAVIRQVATTAPSTSITGISSR
ncbi:hypothetical protein BN10_240008 [Phycicoccus elongatus Lp2]|uniref:Uncharacterized protein n=1 Tax=Phycicoccus elongatus Lp2 TaxID=1193181 RepID=N0E1I0_9MICO|nr:hypothetical protein BN10_240008 [Phycicoccus elongatus Lp2]